MSDMELKPCPFCGGELWGGREHDGTFAGGCQDVMSCGFRMESFDSMEQLAKALNRRAGDTDE